MLTLLCSCNAISELGTTSEEAPQAQPDKNTGKSNNGASNNTVSDFANYDMGVLTLNIENEFSGINRAVITLDIQQIRVRNNKGEWFNLISTPIRRDIVSDNGNILLKISKVAVPQGTYEEVRFILGSFNIYYDVESAVSYSVSIPSSATSGLKLKTSFKVSSCGITNITLKNNSVVSKSSKKFGNNRVTIRPVFRKKDISSTNLPCEESKCSNPAIADANLARAILDATGKSEINRETLESLQVLDAKNKGIFDLVGLSCAKNLKFLDLSYNNISQLSELVHLRNLNFIDASFNNVSSISGFERLSSLKDLRLNNNLINDLSPLSNLTNLNILMLNNNTLTDMSPISALRNITEIYVSGNRINSLRFTENMPGLKVVVANGSNLTSVSTLQNNPKLIYFYAGANSITDASVISDLPLLRNVQLYSNNISNIVTNSNPDVVCLNLANNDISDTSTFLNLSSLSSIDLTNNPIRCPDRVLAELEAASVSVKSPCN